MGAVHSASPDPNGPQLYDPSEGFEEARKKRVVKATAAEMESAHIPLEKRDYCVDHLIAFKVCARKNFPCNWNCAHERHAYLNCTYQDDILRFKEFERERRLLDRKAKKERREAKAAQEALSE